MAILSGIILGGLILIFTAKNVNVVGTFIFSFLFLLLLKFSIDEIKNDKK